MDGNMYFWGTHYVLP